MVKEGDFVNASSHSRKKESLFFPLDSISQFLFGQLLFIKYQLTHLLRLGSRGYFLVGVSQQTFKEYLLFGRYLVLLCEDGSLLLEEQWIYITQKKCISQDSTRKT